MRDQVESRPSCESPPVGPDRGTGRGTDRGDGSDQGIIRSRSVGPPRGLRGPGTRRSGQLELLIVVIAGFVLACTGATGGARGRLSPLPGATSARSRSSGRYLPARPSIGPPSSRRFCLVREPPRSEGGPCRWSASLEPRWRWIRSSECRADRIRASASLGERVSGSSWRRGTDRRSRLAPESPAATTTADDPTAVTGGAMTSARLPCCAQGVVRAALRGPSRPRRTRSRARERGPPRLAVDRHLLRSSSLPFGVPPLRTDAP